MSKARALIVDDEADICSLIGLTLERMEIAVETAGTLALAEAALQQQRFDFCLTDMRLPDGNGLTLVRRYSSRLPMAVITAYGDVDSAVAVLKAGAFDFVSKPLQLDVLRRLVRHALQRAAPATATAGQQLVGDSPLMRRLRDDMARFGRSQAPLYISGESGSGKELVARLVHQWGPRAAGPFIAVNCGAMPEGLAESEFFGHRRGSFTGATADKEGLFAAADGGSLFLDEVTDLSLALQVKLLRVIQERALRPIGAVRETAIDVRLISASHRSLEQAATAGDFRRDLFYRIHVLSLHMPPLRQRKQDLPALVAALLARLTERYALPTRPALAPSALAALQRYDFPGNVRELENILERALALCEQGPIEADVLALGSAVEATETAPEGDIIEAQELRKTLAEARWNRREAARILGISYRQLRYRLQKWGIE